MQSPFGGLETQVKTHDLTFSAHTINCVCHSIRSIFRVLGIYNIYSFANCMPLNISLTLIKGFCNIFWSWMYWHFWLYLYYQISDNDSTIYCGNFKNISNLRGFHCTGKIKFIYSEKATKFCLIFPFLLTVCTVVKSKGKISQNFEAFSEYMNFTTSIMEIEVAHTVGLSCHPFEA